MNDPRYFKSFRLVGQQWRVVLSKNLYEDEESYGATRTSRGLIQIQEPTRDVALEHQQITFWHEVAHAIFHSIGQEKPGKNEQLVDWVGRALHDMMTTGKKP